MKRGNWLSLPTTAQIMTPHPTLPKIDGATLQQLHRTGAMRNADTIARKIARAANGSPAEAIVALAVARHPDMAPADALAHFGAEVDALIAALEASGRELRTTLAAERERMVPIVAKACHRSIEIGSEISAIDSKINWNKHFDTDKRERLRKAGLSGPDLDMVAAPKDTSKLSDTRALLVAELAALEQFLRTRSPEDIPVGFEEAAA